MANRYLKIELSTQIPYSKEIRRLFQNYVKNRGRIFDPDLFLIISNQQFVYEFPLGGYRADTPEDIHTPDFVVGIQVVEEGVLRIFLPWIGIREHSLYAHRVELLTESGQSDLLRIVEPVRHVGRTATRSADRLIRRIEIEERPLRSIRQALPVIPVEDLHALKQPAVGHDQLPIQQVRTLSVAETHAKLPLAVDRIDSVITGAHQKDEQCGPHQVVQSSRIVPGTLLEEVFLTRLVSRQITIIALQGQKRPDQLLRPVADHAVNIDQVLVRVVNDTPHLREVLPDSEEEGAASDKRFDIGFHPGEIRRQRFAQDGQQAALAAYPREARASRRFFLFFHDR